MGNTIDEAMANAAEALRDWVEVTEESGEAVPAPRPLEKLRRDPEVAEALANGASLAAVPLVRQTGKPPLPVPGWCDRYVGSSQCSFRLRHRKTDANGRAVT
jgi:hypothetical protein